MRVRLNNPKVKFYIGDVRDYRSIEMAMRYCCFIHPAYTVFNKDFLQNFGIYYE